MLIILDRRWDWTMTQLSEIKGKRALAKVLKISVMSIYRIDEQYPWPVVRQEKPENGGPEYNIYNYADCRLHYSKYVLRKKGLY